MNEARADRLWSGEQLYWLQALGHTVYLDREALAPETAAVEAASSEAPPARAADPGRADPGLAAPRPSHRPQPVPRAPDEDMAPSSAAPAMAARRGRVALPDRLQLALLRASGLNPGDPATRSLMDTWPLAELRGNPRAKRALWPQLRALRRRTTSS